MEVRDLLRHQFRFAHGFLDQAVADVPPNLANLRLPGSTINTIAQVYAHTVVAEDAFVAEAQGTQPVLLRDGWAPRLGIAEATPRQTPGWAELQPDLALAREYAGAVYSATDAFLASVPGDVLLRELDGPAGKVLFVAEIMLSHVSEHWGEIVALKGVHGLKGLPF